MSFEGARTVDRVGVFRERLAQLGLELAGFRRRAVGFGDYQEAGGISHADRKVAPHSLDAPAFGVFRLTRAPPPGIVTLSMITMSSRR